MSFLTGKRYVTASAVFFFNLYYEVTSLWNFSLLSINESLVIYSDVLPGFPSVTDRLKGDERSKTWHHLIEWGENRYKTVLFSSMVV